MAVGEKSSSLSFHFHFTISYLLVSTDLCVPDLFAALSVESSKFRSRDFKPSVKAF